MVKFHQLNDWMKLIGNLGVFAGLALVALQMQQANHIARSEQEAERDKAYQDLEIGMLGENPAATWVKSVFDPASMSREELRIMDAYLINEIIVLRRTGLHEAAGLLPPGALKRKVDSDTSYFFGNEFAQVWWSLERQHQEEAYPEFVRYMDEAIARLEMHHTAKFYMQIEDGIRDIPPVVRADRP
jgi:hypothetical protein